MRGNRRTVVDRARRVVGRQLVQRSQQPHVSGIENEGSDENIAPDVVDGLRARGCDLRTAWDEQLIGRPDVDVLERAASQRRVVVTHDVAFGGAAIRAGTSFIGIIYLRPGHISPAFVLAVVDALRDSTVEVQAPFIVVAERQQSAVRVRARTAPPW
jgi:predicted nuclease of predicted toxin-antitoxin system